MDDKLRTIWALVLAYRVIWDSADRLAELVNKGRPPEEDLFGSDTKEVREEALAVVRIQASEVHEKLVMALSQSPENVIGIILAISKGAKPAHLITMRDLSQEEP